MSTRVEQKEARHSLGFSERFPVLHFFAAIGIVFTALVLIGALALVAWVFDWRL